MTFDQLPETAQAIVKAAVKRFDVDPAALLNPRQRSPEARRARTEAICALDAAELPGGERRYSLTDIASWFSVSRNSIYVQRSKSPKFTPRRATVDKSVEA